MQVDQNNTLSYGLVHICKKTIYVLKQRVQLNCCVLKSLKFLLYGEQLLEKIPCLWSYMYVPLVETADYVFGNLNMD